MARVTVTLSAEAKDSVEKLQKMLSERLGGGRVTPGFAIGYALKECMKHEKQDAEKE